MVEDVNSRVLAVFDGAPDAGSAIIHADFICFTELSEAFKVIP